MVVVTFHQVTMSLLISTVAFSVAAVATKNWDSRSSIWNLSNHANDVITKAFVIIGTVCACLAFLMELLIHISATFSVSQAIRILTLIFVLVGFASLLIGVSVGGVYRCSEECGFSFWFAAISTVLMFQAVVFYMVAWKCT